jgi:hypothetical protein
MFKKMTPLEHHRSIMPFNYLFMTKEQYEEFIKNTQPPDVPVTTTVITPEEKQDTGVEESKD